MRPDLLHPAKAVPGARVAVLSPSFAAPAADRAADLNAAFGDPEIRAVLATIGGDDQITVIPHLDASLVRADPKPFLGYSDNTNLLSWLWSNGVASWSPWACDPHSANADAEVGRVAAEIGTGAWPDR
jgi:muramoyltetrapeptide carboxypeptidase LdcA involved in peptidoglycan recycling